MRSAVTLDRLQAGDHVRWAFDDDTGLLDPATRFVGTGISAGEKVLCYLEDLEPDDLIRWLTRIGADELERIAMAHHGSTLDAVNGGRWPQLRLRRTTDPPGLRIVGEADLATRDALVAVAAGLTKDAAVEDRPITVDVSELSFADGAAAQALVCAARSAPAGVRVVGALTTLARLISLVGGDDVPGPSIHLDHTDDDVSGSSPEGSEQD